MAALKACTVEKMTQVLRYRETVDIGLHLCLTHEPVPFEPSLPGNAQSNTRPAFRNLLSQAVMGRVHAEQILEDIAAQYQAFFTKSGTRPDFIDGHLHAHQLPGVRQALISFVSSLPPDSRPYIRNTRTRISNLRRKHLPWSKAGFIGFFGSRLEHELRKAGLKTNDGFAGIYDFHAQSNYQDFFPLFIECLPKQNGILVVHPGRTEDWRKQEFEVLNQFPFRPGTINKFS
jgi:hypothetical protein